MIRPELLTIDQLDTDSLISIQQNPLDTGSESQTAAMFLKSTHQGLHDGSTASPGKIETSLRIKPLTEQRCHGRCIGVGHGHATDQKAEQINPVAKEGILKMSIHQWPEGTAEMTQGRQMGKQTTAATQQRSKPLEASRW